MTQKLTEAQKAWLRNYEESTTFEPMFQDDFTSGKITFEELVKRNLRWFEDWSADAHNAASSFPHEEKS